MNQANVQKLLSSMTTYVDHVVAEEEAATALDKVQLITLFVHNHLFQVISEERKSEMYHTTVAALNDGSEDAMEDAFFIKLEALASGDDALIAKIEHLWDVI